MLKQKKSFLIILPDKKIFYFLFFSKIKSFILENELKKINFLSWPVQTLLSWKKLDLYEIYNDFFYLKKFIFKKLNFFFFIYSLCFFFFF